MFVASFFAVASFSAVGDFSCDTSDFTFTDDEQTEINEKQREKKECRARGGAGERAHISWGWSWALCPWLGTQQQSRGQVKIKEECMQCRKHIRVEVYGF